MTPAMKQIVEAMAAEIVLQTDGDFGHVAGEADAVIFAPRDGGSFDLEKVARAGLLAVRDSAAMDETGLALRELPGGYRPGSHSAREIWMTKIDAILREQP